MSNNTSRSASVEPTEPLGASTSKLRSPDAPGSNPVDENAQDHEPKDDTPLDEGGKNSDNTDGSFSSDTPSNSVTPSQGDWQAIWAPTHTAYYFYNSRTNETTWTNPLQPTTAKAEELQADASNFSPSTSSSNPRYTAQAAAAAAGIDPSLAYLDPSLGLPGSTPAGTFTAKFNARTGAFARADARDPSHLSEAERAKRMSEVYFDVGAWEKELERRKAEEEAEEAEGNGRKRKRPSKKDLERFKEQKKLKKIAKTAWLRT